MFGSDLFLAMVVWVEGERWQNKKHLLYIAEVLCVCMCVACWFQAEGEEWQSEGTSSVSCLLCACA